MPTSLGNSSIVKGYLGDTLVSKVYFGDIPLWNNVEPTNWSEFSLSPISASSLIIVGTMAVYDNKLLVLGQFNGYENQSRNNLMRLYADGTLDTSFNPGIGIFSGSAQNKNKIVVLSGSYGKRFVVIGDSMNAQYYVGSGSGYRRGIIVINENGTPYDPSGSFKLFGSAVPSGSNYQLSNINNTPWLIGSHTNYSQSADFRYITPIDVETLDPIVIPGLSGSITASVQSLFQDSKGRVIVGSGNSVRRFSNPTSSWIADPISVWNPGTGSNSAQVIAETPDGKYIFGNSGASAYSGSQSSSLFRVNEDGSRDLTFRGLIAGGFGINKIVVQPDGKILAGGGFFNVNGTTQQRFARLNADGTPDADFNANITISGSNNTVIGMALLPSGDILIGGSFTTASLQPRRGIAQYSQTGNLK
jgi:uncharacterized delta-60 repeat protein